MVQISDIFRCKWFQKQELFCSYIKVWKYITSKFGVFEISNLRSPSLHLVDKKYSIKSYIVKYYYSLK